jgi:BirA family transcriptional regulator, biotin operon repressor / biotin---[acetyl-CoA-carboxylase] ligase
VAQLTGVPIAVTGAPVIRLETVDSTQNHAARLAANGAVDGTVVLAETQTAGRGRRGRIWRDVPGESLLLSVIMRTSMPALRLPLLSLAAAVGVAEALRDRAGVDARLKWPNDVHVNERKIAGILLEGRGDVVLLGVGVNVAQREVAADLAATSIALEGGDTDRDALLVAMRAAIGRRRAQVERGELGALRARWTELATTPGRRVTVDGVTGMAQGLDEDGALLVLDEGGATVRVLAGDVAVAP